MKSDSWLDKKTWDKIMSGWDYWRSEIAYGNKSSAPRDWFEGVIESLAPNNGWISVDDRLPEARKKVIAYYKNSNGKSRRVMAEHIPAFTVTVEDYYDFDTEFECDYKDGEEIGYVKESWHEIIDNWGDYTGCEICNGEVTHWQPLPQPPGETD